MFIILTFFVLITGYLIGSVCCALVVSQLFGLPDPRTEGSRNPGATNVMRLSGKKYAAIVLLGDILKGTIPVVLAYLLELGYTVQALAGFAAVIGHMYPVFFGFKGGKGVATAIGVCLGLNFLFGTLAIATWLVVAAVMHYSSLASIITIFMMPIYSVIMLGTTDATVPLMAITVLVLFKHRDNITRLSKGKESKIRFKHSLLEDIMEEKKDTTHPGAETRAPEPPMKRKEHENKSD